MENKKYYTDERNVQIVVSLLKAHGIRKVVVSPGTTNLTLVGSLMYDGEFELYSSVDERSAAYLACGLASESGEPVALSCTGATASRNYMSGLTEAYYRKLPILAITSHQGINRIGHLIPQNIDRRVTPNDITRLSVALPVISNKADERFCEIEANKAMLELKRNGGGPVHINLFTTYSRNFNIKTLPPAHVIRRYSYFDTLPEIPCGNGHIAVFIGSHKDFSEEETKAIDRFCASYDAVVFCDHTSGYHGYYGVHSSLIFRQKAGAKQLLNIDTLIHIGEVSGDYDGTPTGVKHVWRVSEDGELRDTFGTLTNVFQMKELYFFSHYQENDDHKEEYLMQYKSLYQSIIEKIPEIPFSNIWIASILHNKFPVGSQVHLGILNTLRSWNMFLLPTGVTSRCNVGGFGIDGILSTIVGSSLANPNKLFYGILGDLAFFYDMNALGNRHIGNNLRILLINNGRGTEFRNYDHPCSAFGDDADKFMSAAGHFGQQSKDLVKHYAEDLGFNYISASSKEEFLSCYESFISSEVGDKSIIMECFTDSEDESNALNNIRSIIVEDTTRTFKDKAKGVIANAIGEKGMQIIDILRH